MSDYETLSSQLRARRKALGLSLSEVARRAGTSPATLSRYESGWSRFEIYTLRKLASALDCELRIELQPKRAGARSAADVSAAVLQLGRLFWDHPLAAGDLATYPTWVIERVLEFGKLEDIHTLQALMGRKTFLETVAKTTRLSPRTRSFWQQILRLEGIPCTRKYSRVTAWNS